MQFEADLPAWRHLGAVLSFVLCAGLAHPACAQEAVLTFTGPVEPAVAGCRVSLWLNALNPSSREVAWTFPQTIAGRFIAPEGSPGVSLELRHPAEARETVIAPGAFVRREYVLLLPALFTGQRVVEVSGLSAGRIMLDVQAAPPVVAGVGEEKPVSPFQKFVKAVEPEEPGKPFDPGRFFKQHISGHEPFYFIAGTKSPNAKIQLSFKYQLLNADGPLAARAPLLKGFHAAYTQTSLWDWNSPSAPFYDTSYKPEFLYSWDRVAGGELTNWYQLDLQGGLKHESNGKDGPNSRSLNIAYFRPTLTLGRDAGLQFTLQPRAWVYLGDLGDNPDIADYRGYVDLRAVVGWKRGLQLSALGRMGVAGDHESVQLDLTYPTMKIFGSFSVYLHVQYFTGYGESLLAYNQRSETLRAGFSIYR